MFIAEAKRLCPDVIVVPYEFDKYTSASEQVSAPRHRLCRHVTRV